MRGRGFAVRGVWRGAQRQDVSQILDPEDGGPFPWLRSARSLRTQTRGRGPGGRGQAAPSQRSGPAELAFVVTRVGSAEGAGAQSRRLTKVCGVYFVTTEGLLMVFKAAAHFMCLFFYLCCVSKSHIYFPNMEQSCDCSSYKQNTCFRRYLVFLNSFQTTWRPFIMFTSGFARELNTLGLRKQLR